MRIIREIQNAIDGKYHIIDEEKEKKRKGQSNRGVREDDSRVVRKLVDLGLAIPQNEKARPEKRR